LELVQRVLVQLELGLGCPRSGELQLVEDPKLHRDLPTSTRVRLILADRGRDGNSWPARARTGSYLLRSGCGQIPREPEQLRLLAGGADQRDRAGLAVLSGPAGPERQAQRRESVHIPGLGERRGPRTAEERAPEPGPVTPPHPRCRVRDRR